MKKKGVINLTRKLVMYFKNLAGNTVALSLDNPREDISSTEVQSAMNVIVGLNVLESASGKIVSVHAAKIVEQTTTELDV